MRNKGQKTVTVEGIDKVLKFLPIFEKEGYSFCEWKNGEEENGVSTFPHCSYSKEVCEFEGTLYEEGFIINFDWGKWQEQAKLCYSKPGLLNTADIITLQKLLTTHIRKDRFCEGHLAGVLEDGHIVKILLRLKDIRDKMKDVEQKEKSI